MTLQTLSHAEPLFPIYRVAVAPRQSISDITYAGHKLLFPISYLPGSFGVDSRLTPCKRDGNIPLPNFLIDA